MSWGTGCAAAGYYGVYSKVSKFTSFISQYVSPPEPEPLPIGLTGPYGLWNGFLGMVNILELENTSTSPTSAYVYLVRSDGVVGTKQLVTLDPSSKQDIVLNTLSGFQNDAYGVIKVVGSLSGRIFYYRPAVAGTFDNFQFAFGVQLADASSNTSFVNFNTNQPSTYALDYSNLVANWLTIVNVSASPKNFTVRKYDQSGGILSESSMSISSYGRVDIDGGHVNPGPAYVGLLEIIPDSGTEYVAQLMRYGYARENGFDFAFPLDASSGFSSASALPLSTTGNAQNWLEVTNASNSTSSFGIKFYSQSSQLLDEKNISLGAHSQMHFNINEILGSGAIGQAVITPESRKKGIASSMHYFRNSQTGSILSMYGSRARSPFSDSKLGSYNLYLNMSNYLKLSNTGDTSTQYNLSVRSFGVELARETVGLAAHASVDIPLHDATRFSTSANTYGVVNIEPQGSATSYIGEIFRIKSSSSTGELEFVAPTDLR